MHYVFSDCSRRFPGAPLWAAALLLLVGAGLGPAAAAQAQQRGGLRYTLAPVGKYAYFGEDDDSGLEDRLLYGGELGIGFGRYLEVSALYLQRGEAESTFGASNDDTALLPRLAGDRQTDVQQYGGRVRLNLNARGGGSGFVPFVSGGAGVLHLDPEDIEPSESVYVTGGAGLTFGALDRYAFTVAGQGMGYRYNPAATFFTGSELRARATGQQSVFVPSVRAALRLYLGGSQGRRAASERSLGRRFFSGVRGARFSVEPFYGRVEFADALKGTGNGQFYRDQNVAGLNAGVELGPYVGLRGFYWRGASGRDGVFDELGEAFQPIAFYGGEVNLRLGASSLDARGFVPYGIVGGGYVNALDGYADEVDGGVGVPDDRYFATLGGGVEVPLSRGIALRGGLRSLFMSTQEATDVSDPDEVHANLTYTAGVQFSLGGGRRLTPAERLEERALERELLLRGEARANIGASERALLAEIQRLQARVALMERRDELEELGLTDAQIDAVLATEASAPVSERPGVSGLPPEVQQQVARAGAARETETLTDRVIALPVPRVGEIYVRIGESGEDGAAGDVEASYAPPTVITSQGEGAGRPAGEAGALGTLSREEISEIISQELRQAREEQALTRDEIAGIVEQAVQQRLAAARDADADIAARNAQIQRLEQQIDDLRDSLNDELNNLETRQLLRERQGERVVVGEDGEARIVEEPRDPFAASRLTPTAGFSYGGGGRFLIGVRGDYGGGYRNFRAAGLRFMPEVAVGIGEGVGVNVLANVVYDFEGRLVNAYLPGNDLAPYAGAGVGLTTETGIGVNALGGLSYPTPQGSIFLEFSTVDFFDYNRVLIGYRIAL